MKATTFYIPNNSLPRRLFDDLDKDGKKKVSDSEKATVLVAIADTKTVQYKNADPANPPSPAMPQVVKTV